MLRNFPLCNLHQIIFHFHIFILFFNIYGRIHEIYLKNLLLLRDVLFIMTCAEFPLNTCFYIKIKYHPFFNTRFVIKMNIA